MEIRHTLKIEVPRNAVESSKIIEGMILESWEAIKLEPWKYMSPVVAQIDFNRPQEKGIDLERRERKQVAMRYLHKGAQHVWN